MQQELEIKNPALGREVEFGTNDLRVGDKFF